MSRTVEVVDNTENWTWIVGGRLLVGDGERVGAGG